MQQPRMIRSTQEFDQVDDRRDVACQSLAKVRVEVREPGAIDHHIQRAAQALPYLGSHAQPRLTDVTFDYFDSLGDEIREPLTEPLLQGIKHRRFFE